VRCGFRRNAALQRAHCRKDIGTMSAAERNQKPQSVFDRGVKGDEALTKNELQKVRDWAEARIKGGNVPSWSWQHHVTLIEAVDAILHDMSVANDAPRSPRLPLRNFRLVEREGERSVSVRAAADSVTRRKSGGLH
jgi:hypothetical protein